MFKSFVSSVPLSHDLLTRTITAPFTSRPNMCDSNSPLLRLSHELLVLVLDNLRPTDLHTLDRTCRHLRRLTPTSYQRWCFAGNAFGRLKLCTRNIESVFNSMCEAFDDSQLHRLARTISCSRDSTCCVEIRVVFWFLKPETGTKL